MADWEDEMNALVRSRQRALVRYAYLLCGDAKDAEDLVQDALVKVYSRRSTPPLASAEGYLRRAVLSVYIDLYRRRTRWSAIKHRAGRAERIENTDQDTDRQVDVAVALERLSPRQRACVILHYYEDLSVATTAQQLGCSAGAVKRHLSDARAVLEALLGPVDAPASQLAETPQRDGWPHDLERFAPPNASVGPHPSHAPALPIPDLTPRPRRHS